MVGISIGPRKFAMQKTALWWEAKYADGAADISPELKRNCGGWNTLWYNTNGVTPAPPYNERTSMLCWNSTKCDLRALNQGNKGLDILGVALQEASIIMSETRGWINEGQDVYKPEFAYGVYIYDVVTTTPMNVNDVYAMMSTIEVPSFLPLMDDEYLWPAEDQRTSGWTPSQVVYGVWRWLAPSRDTESAPPLELIQSSEFGFAETVVAPEMFWTRVVTVPDIRNVRSDQPNSSPFQNEMYIPSSNLILSANVRTLTDGEELAQMHRGAGR